jgi:DNA polymerase V
MKLIGEHFDIQSDLIQNPATTYFMRVGSDAMVGAGIYPGDKLIVDKAKKQNTGILWWQPLMGNS